LTRDIDPAYLALTVSTEGFTATNRLVGRRRERAELSDLLDSPKAELLALYGRRRVGKTYLVREFFSGRATFFEVSGRVDGSRETHLRLFAESLSEAFSPGVEREPPTTWHQAFRTLWAEVERRRRSKRKIVLFFDELPWLATRRSDCIAELEHFWNRYASTTDNVILIVCGSAASWMIEKIVRARGGLHNRLTKVMRLLPFTLPEAREFLGLHAPSLGRDEVVELYMALGGIPHYLQLVQRRQSVAQTIDRLCFDGAGPLHTELDDVFASLFSESEAHRRIVEVLARRRTGASIDEALEGARIPSGGGATRILTALEEAGFITSDVPYGRRSRDRILRVTDELSLFALRWLESGRRRSWAQLRGTPAWRAWAGLAFEAMCLKHIDLIKNALGIRAVASEVSPWSHRAARGDEAGCQIDLLIDRADHVISICELKYTEEPFTITKAYAQQLREKLSIFRRQTKTKKALRLVMVSARGIAENRWSRELVDEVVTLDDLIH
jgi:hypothetical protein